MAHARSNSLASRSHPLALSVEDHFCRLKTSEAASSLTASSICRNLCSLVELHEGLNDLIQLPSTQSALHNIERCDRWTDELLDGSLRLLDVCGIARDVMSLMKESVQELESSLRRIKGDSCLSQNVDSFMASRKKVDKLVAKCLKSSNKFDDNCFTAHLEKDSNLMVIINAIRKTETISFSVLKSVVSYASSTTKARSKPRGWSLVSKFVQPKRVHLDNEQETENVNDLLYVLNIQKSSQGINGVEVQKMLKHLKTMKTTIKEIEDNLQAFFKSLLKIRVSLLNVLNY